MTRRAVVLLAVCFPLASCQEANNPDILERPAFELAADMSPELQPYLAPHTVTRTNGPGDTQVIPVGGDRYSFFMEPFVLRVRTSPEGSAPVVGWVRVDGVEVLGPADLRRRVAEHVLEVPITESSVLTVELVGRPGGSLTLSMEAAFQPAPTIVVQSPARGAMLRQGTVDPSPVEISGQACHDRFPITRLEINGSAVPVTGDRLCEPFTVEQSSRWGMNLVTGLAENVRGRRGELAQAYLRSPTYFPVATAFDAAARVPGALVAQLNQPVLDDNTADLDDIAAVLERHVAQVDLTALNPIASECFRVIVIGGVDLLAVGYRVNQGAVTFTNPQVTITAKPGVLDVAVTFSAFSIALDAAVGVENDCPVGSFRGVTGTIGASTVTVGVPLIVNAGGGTPHVSAGTPAVSFEGLTVNLDVNSLGFVDVSLDFIATQVLVLVRGRVEELMGDQIAGDLSRLTQDVLAEAAFVTAEPVGVGDVALQFAAGLDGISFAGPAGTGFAKLSGFTQVVPVSPRSDRPAPPFGPIRGDGAAPAFGATTLDLGFGVKDDAVNQLLWAAWREGAFDLPDVGAFVPHAALDGIQLAITTHLPPVVMPGATPNRVEVGVGDIEVEATIDPAVLPGGVAGPPLHARLFVTASVAATLDYDAASNRVGAPDPTVQAAVQLADIATFVDEPALAAQIAQAVEAAVEEFISQAFAAFPLPAIDLPLPPGSGLPPVTLRLHDVVVDRAGNYTRLAGRVSVP